jgi:integrase
MNERMRLFCKNGWYHVALDRNRSKALRTRNKVEAESIFKEMKREWLRGRLMLLEDHRKATISELKDIYCARTGVSKWTIKKDELSLKLLQDALGNLQISTLTRLKFREFKKICLARRAKPITVNGYLRHIKAALRYAAEEGYLEKVPKIEMETIINTLPRFLCIEDIKTLVNKAKETDDDFYRYIVFNLYTGCRRRESLNLDWSKIDFKERTCRVIGKDSRERIIHLLPPVLKALAPQRKDIGKVFVQYHPDTVSKKFHGLARVCGIDARLHDLRHSCATYLLKSGVPLEVVQEILGHSQISTTMIYAKVLDEVVKKEMKKLRFK